MVQMKEKNMLRILASSHALEILEELNKSPLRFTDMDHVCPSRKTRYIRLRELEQQTLIKTTPRLLARRSYTYYETTKKGYRSLELAKKLLSINQNLSTESAPIAK
jgi:DNA-binding HxlR family transcriptional regulator